MFLLNNCLFCLEDCQKVLVFMTTWVLAQLSPCYDFRIKSCVSFDSVHNLSIVPACVVIIEASKGLKKGQFPELCGQVLCLLATSRLLHAPQHQKTENNGCGLTLWENPALHLWKLWWTVTLILIYQSVFNVIPLPK